MTHPTAAALVEAAPPYVHMVESGDVTDQLLDEFRSCADDAWIRVLDGRAAASASEFFDQASDVMELPAYFGRNWNAFQDVLYDLPGGPKLLVVTDAGELLSAEPPNAFATFVSILQASAERRAEAGAHPLHLLLVARAGDADAVLRRVADADAGADDR